MGRFYANENFPLPVFLELRRLGHDVLTIQETGKAGQATPDQEVLAFAVSQRRTVLTINRLHFVRLHKRQSAHAGIVVCTLDLDFTGLASRIHQAIQNKKNLDNELLRINRPAR
jgi:Domain of unknown function (DUF5615)